MHEHDRERDDNLSDQIESISRRTGAETLRLTTTMLTHCWPGGSSDRTEPAALEWVRRWRPHGLALLLPHCSCSTGRCLVCN